MITKLTLESYSYFQGRSARRMSIEAKDHPYLSEKQEMMPMKLGINGLGRIGKLTVWHHVSRKSFKEIIINIGRNAGGSLDDVAHYIERDSTYGSLSRYLYGFRGNRAIEELKENENSMRIHGIPVKVLTEHRNPKDIGWRHEGVELVVDCSGVFRNPEDPAGSEKGSLRGHLEAGARKVILSAPFKMKDTSQPIPEDAITLVNGINNDAYVPTKHQIISGASCTTTCLAFIIKALLDHFGADAFLTASMVTVHAVTSSQEILDRLPEANAEDMRKSRSVFNNIILTTTGAAEALGHVIPEMKNVGFMAESVRVPVNTGSIVILAVSIQNENFHNSVDRNRINEIYRDAAQGYLSNYISYSDYQHVSSDIIGTVSAAIIEGRETRASTGIIRVSLGKACKLVIDDAPQAKPETGVLEIPVTQAVIYGWYDNELGSFSHILGQTTVEIAKQFFKTKTVIQD
ncbi:MAG: hypothetical protein M0P57_10045 [Syntrophales bacterium]|nr:hypothetical protein [Syntrophales bacterium]